MKIVYTGEEAPESFTASIFLAGPSPRKNGDYNWRHEAFQHLEEAGFQGVVFAPIYPDDARLAEEFDYDKQIEWETRHLNSSDLILFWIPRDLEELPGFTTNVEFGLWVRSGKVLMGSPSGTPKMAYLDWWADRESVENFDDLKKICLRAAEKLEEGAIRVGGERDVPLHLWKKTEFQRWLRTQKAAGNRLDGASVVWTLRVGKNRQNTVIWSLKVKMWIASEDRMKSNEVVIFRPDVSAVVAYAKAANWLDTEILCVREYRSASVTNDSLVHELPGGSSPKEGASPQEVIVAEVEEETSLVLDPKRVRYIGKRQVSSTLCGHMAHLFTVELSAQEMFDMKWMQGSTFGKTEEGEITYIDVRTVRDILLDNDVDWLNLGLIFRALLAPSRA